MVNCISNMTATNQNYFSKAAACNNNKHNNISSGKGVPLPPNFAPSDEDVICGRGKDCYNHEGNRRFRAIIDKTLQRYVECASKHEKGLIVVSIVDHVRQNSPTGAGFVRLDSKTKQWFEIGDDCAREKVGQTIREALIQMDPEKLSEKRKRRARNKARRKARRQEQKGTLRAQQQQQQQEQEQEHGMTEDDDSEATPSRSPSPIYSSPPVAGQSPLPRSALDGTLTPPDWERVLNGKIPVPGAAPLLFPFLFPSLPSHALPLSMVPMFTITDVFAIAQSLQAFGGAVHSSAYKGAAAQDKVAGLPKGLATHYTN